MFVGLDAYVEAGGVILRDLFTEDRGGWFEDVPLLDRMVAEKLAGIAEEVREREGWKWAEAHLDYPSGHTCSRVYPSAAERTEAETGEIDALRQEFEALAEEWSDTGRASARSRGSLDGIGRKDRRFRRQLCLCAGRRHLRGGLRGVKPGR